MMIKKPARKEAATRKPNLREAILAYVVAAQVKVGAGGHPGARGAGTSELFTGTYWTGGLPGIPS